MSHTVRRRTFLKAAGIVATGQCALASEAGSAPSNEPASSHPRLFSGCCAYSYAKHLASRKMSMEDFIAKAVDLGIDGVDITTYWLKSTDPGYLTSLRHFAFKQGVPFSGIAIRSKNVPTRTHAAGC